MYKNLYKIYNVKPFSNPLHLLMNNRKRQNQVSQLLLKQIDEWSVVVFEGPAIPEFLYTPDPQVHLQPFFRSMVRLLVIFPIDMPAIKGIKTM